MQLCFLKTLSGNIIILIFILQKVLKRITKTILSFTKNIIKGAGAMAQR